MSMTAQQVAARMIKQVYQRRWWMQMVAIWLLILAMLVCSDVWQALALALISILVLFALAYRKAWP